MCPPGVDQTCRTTQRWRWLSPAIGQQHTLPEDELEGNERSSPQAFLQGTSSMGAFEKLAQLPRRANTDGLYGDTSAQPLWLSPMEGLPCEMISMVVSEMSPNDIVALGMCSQTLWSHTLAHVERDIKQAAAPWAGKPLVCTGTWLEDLPPAIYELYPNELTSEERYRDCMKSMRPGMGMRSLGWYGPCPARKWNWSTFEKYEDVGGKDCCRKWKDALNTIIHDAKLPSSVSSSLWSSLGGAMVGYLPSQQDRWILRNLTTLEYVRLDVAWSEDSVSFQAFAASANWLSLDQALTLRICWGTSQSYRADKETTARLLRGQWAGHCFEVVNWREELGLEWKDVTAQLVEEGKRWSSNTPWTERRGFELARSASPSDDED
ncbi:hypothetical protein LTR17_010317 [Elasticomyces elasticus]|nr:hypothetical protein LTR17_010317 [Elasticomyces elasticus]